MCSRHINENFSVETVSTIKWLHTKLKRVLFSIFSTVVILSGSVTTTLLENEATLLENEAIGFLEKISYRFVM